MLTAKEAMEYAINRAQVGDYEGGFLWTTIARELRQGESAARSLPVGPQSMTAEQIAAEHFAVFSEPVPSEPVIGLAPDGQLAYGQRFMTGRKADQERAETEVMRRVPAEATPAYEAAGESLGETQLIPDGIAHPQADSQGANSTCVRPSCGIAVVWVRNAGWLHDVEGHPASCENARTVVQREP